MTDYLITQKPTFLSELLALPPKEAHQVQEKLAGLVRDPRPDGKVKKQLKGWTPSLYRLRSGNYRIFYTFDAKYVSLLALRRRAEDTYDEEIEPEDLGGTDVDLTRSVQASGWAVKSVPEPRAATPLPVAIDRGLLTRLHVPQTFHERLMEVSSREHLLDCRDVPDELLLRLDEVLFERPLSEVLEQPDLLSGNVDDLFRFKEGDLAGFLLKLSPEQERIVTRHIGRTEPVLVRGGPGSGKSTIAIYRAAALAKRLLPSAGERAILFTTYTNALASVSRGLLKTLLPAETSKVDVTTADAVVRRILADAGVTFRPASQQQILAALREARSAGAVGRDPFERRQALDCMSHLTDDYLYDEISTVLDAREVETVEDYAALTVPGREPLNQGQRRSIWAIKADLDKRLEKQGIQRWSVARRHAAQIARSGRAKPCYDAMVIDEAQDLEPTTIAVLRALLKQDGELFVTADANQSIYGASFRWSDTHRQLETRNEAEALTANFRSTREIAAAAFSYLRGAELDDVSMEQVFIHEGPLPALRTVRTPAEETALLARFITAAARQLHLTKGSAAVLCPSASEGERIASGLEAAGIEAVFMLSKDLDIDARGVKVMPLRSAKGLEFPIVALAGFWPPYPFVPPGAGKQEREYRLKLDRRTLFVGMSRAMRALLVVRPERPSGIFDGFDETLWNTSGARRS